jgi:phosphoglycerol transferase
MPKKLSRESLIILAQILSVSLLALFVRGYSWSDLYVMQMAGDGLTNYATAKGFVDGLSGIVNYNLGAPHGLSIFSVPSLDIIYLGSISLVAVIAQNGIFAVNFIFYLGFGLAFASSFWVLKKRSSPKLLNLILSLSFAFIPEHWSRQGHVALSMYWTIPLSVYFCILLGTNAFEKKYQKTKNQRGKLNELFKLFLLLIFLTFQGSYYSFFTLFFAGSVLVLNIISSKKIYKLSLGIFFAQVLFFLSATTILAKIATSQGTNLSVFQRATWESILYGGQLPYLFLPWPGSGIPGTSRIQAVLTNAYQGSNEFQIWSATLISLISIAIFCCAILNISRGKLLAKKNTVELQIYQMFFLGFFLYISGGIGFLIAVIEPQLRAWNRVSFFLAFLAIIWLVEQVPKIKLITNSIPFVSKRIALIEPVTYFLLLSLVLVDQFPIGLKIQPLSYRQYQEEVRFFSATLDNYLPKDCVVMQIPAAKYPEMPPIEKMADYDLLYPYLFTKNIKFTYGSIKGSEQSNWQELLPKSYSISFIELLAANNFCGLMWDRNGLRNEEFAQLTDSLENQGLLPHFSRSKRWGFVNLSSVQDKLSNSQISSLRNKLLDAPFVYFDAGFSTIESGPEGSFIWATRSKATIKIVNPSNELIRKKIEFQVKTSPMGNPRDLQILTAGIINRYKLGSVSTPIYDEYIEIPAKSTAQIEISVSGKGDKVSGDPRTFFFQVVPKNNFESNKPLD